MMVVMACTKPCIYYISLLKSTTLFFTVTTVWYLCLCFCFALLYLSVINHCVRWSRWPWAYPMTVISETSSTYLLLISKLFLLTLFVTLSLIFNCIYQCNAGVPYSFQAHTLTSGFFVVVFVLLFLYLCS